MDIKLGKIESNILERIGGCALRASTCDIQSHETKTVLVIDEKWHRADTLSFIHRTAKQLTSNPTTLFDKKPLRDGLWQIACKTPTAKRFLDAISTPFQSIVDQYHQHQISPIFHSFECVARRIPTPWREIVSTPHTGEVIDRVVRRLNVATKVLVARLKSQRMRSAYSAFRRNAQKGFHSIVGYFQKCMSKRSNLTIIRIDLHLPESGTQSTDQGTLADATAKIKSLRNDFTNHIRSKLNDGLIGYLSKVEIGATRGPHIHFVILLDAALHQQDVNIARHLGEEWKKNITKGKGNYFNCNANKHIYRHKSIGRVNTNDEEVITGLRFIAAYLTLGELYVKAKFPDSFRSLCKGLPPRPGNQNGGRPSAHRPSSDITSFCMKEVTKKVAFI